MMVQKLRKLKLAAAQLTSGQSKNNLVFFFLEKLKYSWDEKTLEHMDLNLGH